MSGIVPYCLAVFTVILHECIWSVSNFCHVWRMSALWWNNERCNTYVPSFILECVSSRTLISMNIF